MTQTLAIPGPGRLCRFTAGAQPHTGGMLAAALCLAALAATAEPPPVPDPIGLGERLALIDHLHEAYGQKPPAGATLEELRALYAAQWQARNQPAAAAATGPVDTIGDEIPDTGRAEREARLRRRILDRHGVEADPGADETALLRQLQALDAARSERDRQAIAERIAADPGRSADAAIEPEPEPGPAGKAAPPKGEPRRPAAATAAGAQIAPGIARIAFAARGVSDCWLASGGESRCLLVTFGTDHNGAFGSIRQDAWARVSQSPHFRRSVLLLGHGRGNDVGGENIETHLRANKRFYETMGGTMPEAPIECLILASCAEGSADQMRLMRDGLGYFPTWRVATGPRSAATGFSVIAAVTDLARKPARPAWRGLYRMGTAGDAVAAFGEIGEGGERAETTYWRLLYDETERRWKTVEQR